MTDKNLLPVESRPQRGGGMGGGEFKTVNLSPTLPLVKESVAREDLLSRDSC